MAFCYLRETCPPGKHHWVVHEGGFWSVYWMTVVIWVVVLPFSSHLAFVTKPAPTKDSIHNYEWHSHLTSTCQLCANKLRKDVF